MNAERIVPRTMIRRLNEELKREFGTKVYKIGLSLPVTCPNRDGTSGTGGCIFCTGSDEFTCGGDLASQIRTAKLRVASKVSSSARYIAYFQSYTNTYAPAEKLREWFSVPLNDPEIVAISIATRPDCLPEDVLDLLSDLNRKIQVWVELGLQTIHPVTAAYIRRGYDLSEYDRAITELKKRGIKVITHQILGLPGETAEMMIATTRYISHAGSDGIKFHMLYVSEGTDLAQEYREGRVNVMEMEQYFAILGRCIENLSPEVTIHRMTGDGDKKTLIAPLWTADKKNVLNRMNRYFEEQRIEQGKNYN